MTETLLTVKLSINTNETSKKVTEYDQEKQNHLTKLLYLTINSEGLW